MKQISIDNPWVMREAWRHSIACYQPLDGSTALEAEGGVTQASMRNLRAMAVECGPANRIEIKQCEMGSLVLFGFPDGTLYLASGFSVGYMGTGPSGLAEILGEFGFGERLEDINAMPRDYEGHMVRTR